MRPLSAGAVCLCQHTSGCRATLPFYSAGMKISVPWGAAFVGSLVRGQEVWIVLGMEGGDTDSAGSGSPLCSPSLEKLPKVT